MIFRLESNSSNHLVCANCVELNCILPKGQLTSSEPSPQSSSPSHIQEEWIVLLRLAHVNAVPPRHTQSVQCAITTLGPQQSPPSKLQSTVLVWSSQIPSPTQSGLSHSTQKYICYCPHTKSVSLYIPTANISVIIYNDYYSWLLYITANFWGVDAEIYI